MTNDVASIEALSEDADGGHAYTVLYPLWSKGAVKVRILQVPDGEVIDISDDRSWNDPVGTRVFKTLRMGDQRVENGQLRRRRVAGSAACTPGTATMPP